MNPELVSGAEEHLDSGRSAPSCLALGLLVALIAWSGVSGLEQYFHASRYVTAYFATAVLVVVVAAVCWRRRRGRTFVVLALLGAAHFAGWSCWWSLGPESSELEAEGDSFVSALARYHAQNGRYPAALEDARCEPRWNRFGGWGYASSPDGSSWQLAVGDYFDDGFELFRDSGDDDWYRNR